MAERRAGALLVDWGGVLTTSLFDSFRAFCADEGLEPETLRAAFGSDPRARELLIGLEEGRVEEGDFELHLAELIGVEADGLISRMFAGAGPDEEMIAAVRAVRDAGLPTGLVSNSWGTHRYPRELLAMFDGVVISGEVGVRKPAPAIYELGAQRIGMDPRECVFVDDLPFNLEPAKQLGMATVHHVDAATTLPELERLLGVELSGAAA